MEMRLQQQQQGQRRSGESFQQKKITPFSVHSPGSPELPFITIIFMRPVLWRLAVFGGQETEHVKYTPPAIRITSKRVIVGSVCYDKRSVYSDFIHTQCLLAVYYIYVCFSNLWLISARADPWGLMGGSSGSSGLRKRKW